MSVIRSGSRTLEASVLAERAERAAFGLESIGIKANDSVALILRNDLAFFEASSAVGQVGAYPVPMNWHATVEEASYLLRDCDARAVIIHADLFRQLQAAIPEGVAVLVEPTPPEIAAAYGVPAESCVAPAGQTSWSDWLAQFPRRPRRTSEPPGAIIYTGGTTGRPKGVRRPPPTTAQYLASVEITSFAFGIQAALMAALAGKPPSRVATVIAGPMYHSAPNAYGSLSLRAGADVILQARFDPEQLLQLIELHRITHLHLVPTMFVRLLKLPADIRARYDLSSLEFVVHAAAPCPPHVKRAMIEWWGQIINEYYGSTETGAVVFCSSSDWLAHPGTVGKPMKDIRLRVLREDGTDAAVREPGEVYCRLTTSADFTYHGDDEKRRKAERDGLFSVGDIGYVDEDGYLYLCDRKNHMVISGGVNIYPAEIESELLKVPGVADCAVFGVPDDEFGEALCAWVQPNPGLTLDANDVRTELSRHMARYKIPKIIEFTSTLPREDSGKIFKRKLREPYWAKAGRSI